jgi:hypothetical protein
MEWLPAIGSVRLNSPGFLRMAPTFVMYNWSDIPVFDHFWLLLL